MVTLPPLSALIKDATPSGVSPGHKSPTTPGGKSAMAQSAKEEDSLWMQKAQARGKPSDGGHARNVSSMDVTLFPRRKAGQKSHEGGRAPVVLSFDLLETYFGMPLHLAAKKLGICQTAIKKVCRRLGIKKWPYKDTRVVVKAKKDDTQSESSDIRSSPQDLEAQIKEEEERVIIRPIAIYTGRHNDTLKGEDEVITAVHALLSLNSDPTNDFCKASYVDLIRQRATTCVQ